jgi:Na+/H+-dicarboxylate symporter
MKHKFGLLPKVLLAIALGIVFGLFVPEWFTRIALTFNNIFGNFLNFVIPLLILGLVAPGIADLGSKAGRQPWPMPLPCFRDSELSSQVSGYYPGYWAVRR